MQWEALTVPVVFDQDLIHNEKYIFENLERKNAQNNWFNLILSKELILTFMWGSARYASRQ